MLIYSISSAIICLIFVLTIIGICLIGLAFFNKSHAKESMPKSNEVTGIIFGALSLIYSLIISFAIIAVWEDYEDLNSTIDKEADKLTSIMAQSYMLPENVSELIREDVVAYSHKVVTEEWTMQQVVKQDEPDPLTNLRLLLHTYLSQGEVQEKAFSILDETLNDISDLRRDRLSHTRSHVPGLVWFILITDSVIVIYLFFFFQVESVNLKRIFLSLLSGMLAMSLFLVYMLDHPFLGSTQVSNKPFITIIKSASSL